jgi:hypothetical protein
MNRDLWKQNLTEQVCPAWTCPTCGKGTVVLTPKSLTHKETVMSKQAHSHEEWGPELFSFVFTAWAQCSYSSCKEEFLISGTGGMEPEYNEDGDVDFESCFYPILILPMPDIIKIPEKCPDGVAQELRSSFKLYYIHNAACAGRIRVALERLMDFLGVTKKKRNKLGKFDDLTLHKRIEAFAKNDLIHGSQLMALKWLGNAGSHSDEEVSSVDLLDAFEILEHALSELVDRQSAHVAALAKKLMKKHAK